MISLLNIVLIREKVIKIAMNVNIILRQYVLSYYSDRQVAQLY